MTRLQEIELELLKIFLNICEKNDLRYYLVCGSALGAVKYNGFIPWDDDIDVALPRSDYEKFLKIADKDLPEHVFLQNYKTDPYYPGIGSKLRDCNTTFIEKATKKIDMNHGVYIDVFPLDGYPLNRKEIRQFEKHRWKAYRKRYVKLVPVIHRDIGLTINSILHKIFGIFSNTSKACKEAEDLAKQYPLSESTLWCNYANSMKSSEFAPYEYYGEGKTALFEDLTVRIPEKYHEYLIQKYGDWEADLPEEKQIGHHFYEICDLDRPFTEYIERKNKGNIRIMKERKES